SLHIGRGWAGTRSASLGGRLIRSRRRRARDASWRVQLAPLDASHSPMRQAYSRLRRYSVGVTPDIRRKAALNALDPANPTSNATSVIDVRGSANNALARSMRCSAQ